MGTAMNEADYVLSSLVEIRDALILVSRTLEKQAELAKDIAESHSVIRQQLQHLSGLIELVGKSR